MIRLVKIRSRLMLTVKHEEKGQNSYEISSLKNGRELVLEERSVNSYNISEEHYIYLKKKIYVLKSTKIETGTRGNILLLSDVKNDIICPDFLNVAKKDLTGTILKLPNGMLEAIPSKYTYLILEGSNVKKCFIHMLDAISSRLN